MKGIIVAELLEMEEQDCRFEALKYFGHALGNTFKTKCGSFFAYIDHPFRLLEKVDADLNKDVQKTLSDAKRPSFQSKILRSNGMVMLYVFIDSWNEKIEQSPGSELFLILEK